MKCLLLACLITSVFSTRVVLMMLTHSKRRPELTRSMRDVYRMIDNMPSNITINAFYFTKGCDNCTHTELDDTLSTLRNKYPFVNPIEYTPPEPVKKDTTTTQYF